jgi:membrane protein
VWSWLTDPAVLVYRRAAHGQRKARVLTVEFFLFVREVLREFWNIDGTAKAASLAYTTLLSLIPLMVAFTEVLGKNFRRIFPGFQGDFDAILNAVIPYQSSQISHHLGEFSKGAATASTLGLIVFLFISFRLFLAVEGAVNQIWKVRSSRGYRVKIRSFTMLFFWGPLLMTLSFTSTKSLERNPYLKGFFEQGSILFDIVPIIVLLIAFTMLFWLVPSTRVKFTSALAGAFVTTALFSLVRWGFGVYASSFFEGRFNLIYGAVGLLLIFLVAIEVMWTVILLGVEVSYVYQNLYGVLRASEQQIEDEPRYDLYYALRALVEIARRFERREDAPSSYRLAEQFGTTDPQMVRVLRRLEDGKLVKETGGEWAGFVPGCDPDRISVDEVIAQMEGVRRAVPDVDPSDREGEAIGDLFERLKASSGEALNRMSIGHLVRDLYSPRVARAEDRLRDSG